MASDPTQRPPTQPPPPASAQDAQPAPLRIRFDVMAWAKSQGLKPLPGHGAPEEASPEKPGPLETEHGQPERRPVRYPMTEEALLDPEGLEAWMDRMRSASSAPADDSAPGPEKRR